MFALGYGRGGFCFGVYSRAVERWREVALELKLRMLEGAFTDLAIGCELVERALSQPPTRPGKSWR